MWANPAWGNSGIAFGKADNALQSVSSRYSIQLIDRDGSNKRQLFPFQNENGVQFPELTWSPTEPTLLFIFNGNLYITSSEGSPPRQLTVNTQAGQPRWVSRTPFMANTQVMTSTDTITMTPTATVTPNITVTPSVSVTITAPISATKTSPTRVPVTTTATIDAEESKDNNP
jgi:hypothetical protein